ncbi:MFS transporter [Halegenticoccus soli]|uniref:MFS transporter n=1 Tax=Halegenticoccus soli TaxID=1985678 RepID=UPI000C6EC2FF|nr:MFS transporter [Halegenticoccus soli]
MDRQSGETHVVLFTLWLTVFSLASQVMIVAPILPRIGERLGVESSLLGTLITAYAVGVAVFALLTGPVSDHVGRRRVLRFGTGLLTVALALHAFADGFASLLAVRALAGVAGGMLNGAAVAYVGDYFPRERRGWANGWVMSGLAAGQIAGVPAGTVLAARFGFRAPFLAFTIPAALSFLLYWIAVPQPDVERASDRLSVRGAVGGYGRLLRRSDVAAVSAMFLLIFLGVSTYVAYLPTWLESRRGATAATVAVLFLVGGVANVLAGPRAGRLSDRVGRKPVIVGASLGVTAVVLLTPVVVTSLWLAYPVFFLAMALLASRISPLQALLTELVTGEQRGSAMNLSIGIGQIGFGVGGVVAGAAYVSFGYAGNAAISGASMFLVTALAWRYLPDVRPTPAPTAEPGPGEGAFPSAVAIAEHGVQDALCGPLHEAGHVPRPAVGGARVDDSDDARGARRGIESADADDP